MPTKLARMHTAEHILSAVMKKHYEAPRNLEFHLGEKKTKCDYHVCQSLQASDIKQIEKLVNQEISKNHPVSSLTLHREQAVHYDLWKVPADRQEIRIIKIGDFDDQPCGGNHVTNTQEIGTFRICSFDMKENGRIRIRFNLD